MRVLVEQDAFQIDFPSSHFLLAKTTIFSVVMTQLLIIKETPVYSQQSQFN